MVGAAAEDNEETGPRETLPTNVEVEEEKEEATGPGEDNEEAGPGKTSHTDVEVEEENEEATGPGENIQNDVEDEDSEHTARPPSKPLLTRIEKVIMNRRILKTV